MVIQGVIRPPPEIRAVADRTALYVAKNGRAFERKILGSEKGRTPKFAFLHNTSPFHAYYVDRVQHYEKGGGDEKDEAEKKEKEKIEEEKKKKEQEKKRLEEEEKRRKEKSRKASVIDPVAKALLSQRSKIALLRKEIDQKSADNKESSEAGPRKPPPPAIPPPPALQFVPIVAPSTLSVAQIETIQLVAQFTALDGKGGTFLSQLSHREWNNPAFSFCQPRHAHFAYFSALVDAYRRVLGLWTTTATSPLNDGVKEMANNSEKCLEVAAYRAEYMRDQEQQASKGDNVGETTMAQIDWHDFVVVETIDFPADEVVEISMLPPPPAKEPKADATAQAETDEMEESDEEQDEEQIRVVPSYQPKIVSTQDKNKLETVIDPITGKSVAVKDMPEHMRIQLLDPKWAEERKKFQDKQKESNLVSGDVVASNLERFAQARGDMFGKKEQDLLSRETRLAEANRIIREQKQPSTVGPSLPGAAPPVLKRPIMSLPQPTQAAAGSATEPETKRPRVGEKQGSGGPGQSIPSSAAPPPAKPAPLRPEEAFAAAASGISAGAPAATTSELMSESAFASSLSKPEVTLQVRIPNDQSQMAWNFYGQIVSISIDVMKTVKSVKEELGRSHLNGIPPNKIQLKNTATGSFMKDGLTLAALNIGPTATLELIPRARGGRK